MIIATVTIWGGSFASTKYALAQAEPLVIMCLRFLIGMPVLLAGSLMEGSLGCRQRRGRGAVSDGISDLLPSDHPELCNENGGAANANWMMIATPALVAILGRIFLKERISPKGICGMILAAVGVGIVIGRGTIVTSRSGGFGTWGDAIMLLSVLNWAVFLVISRRVLKKDLPPAFAIFWEMLFSLMSAIPFAYIMGSDFSAIPTFTAGTWGALIFLGAFSSALAYILWFRALSIFTVARVAVFQFLQPIAGVVMAYFLVGERFTPWLFAGGR